MASKRTPLKQDNKAHNKAFAYVSLPPPRTHACLQLNMLALISTSTDTRGEVDFRDPALPITMTRRWQWDKGRRGQCNTMKLGDGKLCTEDNVSPPLYTKDTAKISN